MPSQISRLAAVSQVLYDREVLELRGGNERLRQENKRLKQENSELNLKLFWKEHGIHELHVAMFRVRRRRDFNYIFDDYEWMGPLFESCGLEKNSHNAHLVCRNDYFITDYGTKLWKAKSVDDPELRKLKSLFDALKDMGNGPPTHATT